MPQKTGSNKVRDQWIAEVRDLCTTIKEWCKASKLAVHEESKEILEGRFGTYTVPLLVIRCPGGRIYVEPIGRDIIGAEGRVDIESFPSLVRMLLIQSRGEWVLMTDSGVRWPEPWNKKTFIALIKELTKAA